MGGVRDELSWEEREMSFHGRRERWVFMGEERDELSCEEREIWCEIRSAEK